jgi:hypothetical protein
MPEGVKGLAEPISGKYNTLRRPILMTRNSLTGEDLVYFGCELEIEIADTAHAMRIQIDDHLIPHIKPFGMVVHGFGDERNARHISEGGDKIFAFERAMKLASLQTPALNLAEAFLDFDFGEFFCGHQRFSKSGSMRRSAWVGKFGRLWGFKRCLGLGIPLS